MDTRRPQQGPPLPERASDAPGWPAHASGSGGSTPRSGSHADDPTIVSDSAPRSGDDSGIEITKSLIQGYALQEEIHRGGQGVVYRATQISTKRRVALKVLLEGPFASASARMRFEREIELAASLQHPNIVTILDSGVSEGRYYFAMEYIDGERLHNYLDISKPNITDTLKLFARVCAAVNFAHQRGVIHRDLKPSNILVTADGQPHVLDFGLAKASSLPEPTQTTVAVLSTSGQMLGTLAYMSPEQAAGSINVDVRSDVYSLGVIFYEGLLGQPPYETNAPLGEILRRIAEDEPMAPRLLRARSRYGADIDDEIETILLKALEKDPNRRYQTAGDLGSDIMRYLAGDPIEAKRASGLYMLKKTVRRYRWQAITALALLSMLVVFLVVFATLYSRESYYREKAEFASVQEKEARDAALLEKQAAIDARGEAERNAREAERSAREARESAEKLRRALAHQKVQSGQIAITRGDYSAAREHFWNAFNDDPGDPTALWALRQYYMDTGDIGSLPLPGDAGPTALSSDATRFATPRLNGIAVYALDGGRLLAWYPTPAAPTAITIAGEGVIAGGPGWVRGWRGDDLTPDLVANFSAWILPSHIAGSFDESVFVISGVELLRWRGGRVESVRLPGEAVAAPAYLRASDALVIPTAGGTWVARGADKRLALAPLTLPNGAAPTAICAGPGDVIAVAAGDVFAATLADGLRGEWTTLANGVADVALLDADLPNRRCLVAGPTGEAVLYVDGRLAHRWRIDDRPLIATRLTGPAQILTIDADRLATRWQQPDGQDARRVVVDEPAVAWTVSRDSTVGLMMGQSGMLRLLEFGDEPRQTPIRLPGVRPFLRRSAPEDLRLANSANGEVSAVQLGSRLWLMRRGQTRPTPTRWNNRQTPVLRSIALSDAGTLLALYSRTAVGDAQAISFARIDPDRLTDIRTTRTALAQESRVRIVGSSIRAFDFFPGSENLLVARANGELLLLSPGANNAADGPDPYVWLSIDGAPMDLAFDPAGVTLAVATEDGAVRLFSALDTSARGVIRASAPVASMSFAPDGSVLMLRLTNGELSLYDMESLSLIATWQMDNDSSNPMAAWVGDGDAMLLSHADQIWVYEKSRVDASLRRDRNFATLNRIRDLIESNGFHAAWHTASTALLSDPTLREATLMDISLNALRRRSGLVPDEWMTTVSCNAEPLGLLALSQAAYTGERFDLAFEILRQVGVMLDGAVDAYSAWRLADCAYLTGDYRYAADTLGAIASRPDFHPQDLPRITVERVAALRLMDDPQAAAVLDAFLQRDVVSEFHDPVSNMATQVIGEYLLGRQGESQFLANVRAFLSVFADKWLYYLDDVQFFAGEVARARGATADARSRYMDCIDLSRDAWPANWARYRLKQLETRPTEPAVEPQ